MTGEEVDYYYAAWVDEAIDLAAELGISLKEAKLELKRRELNGIYGVPTERR